MIKKALFLILICFSVFFLYPDSTEIDTTTQASEILENIPKIDEKEAEKKEPKLDTQADTENTTVKSVVKEEEKVTKEEEKKETTETVKEPETTIIKIKEEEKVVKESIQTKTIDDVIVLSTENLGDKVNLVNKYRDSNLIIFEDSSKKIPSSLTYDLEEKKSENKRFYETDDFVPKTIEEFDLVNPHFEYEGKTVKPGKNHISSKLGETVFKKAFDSFKKGEIKYSGILFEKLIHFNHRIAESAYYRGLCRYLEKDNLTAIEYLDFAIKSGDEGKIPAKQLSVYCYQAGSIFYEMDDSTRTIEYFNKALEKNPSNDNVYNGLGLAYYKTGDIDSALTSWKKGKDAGNANCEANYDWLKSKIEK